jgi:peptidoglycan hydrolase-like protein with peptidoglycan-binding domain
MADTSGAIVFGLIGATASVLAVDYWMSEPGESWFDQLKDKLSSSGAAPALPHKRGSHKLGPKPAIPPPGHPSISSSAATQQAYAHAPSLAPTRPAAYPSTISPDMVREAASRINALLHLNLPTTGVLTTELTRAIKQVQQQYGLSPTGLPDAKVLSQLRKKNSHHDLQKAASPLAAQATNFISKTFGGPPSSPSTGPDEGVRKAQTALNAVLKTHLDVDGIMGPLTSGALKEFQKSKGLAVTGKIDTATHDALEKASGGSWLSDMGSLLHLTGAASGDWKSETQSLGQAAQDVISKAISEGDARALASLSHSLQAAGFSQAAAACGGAKASGYYG